MRGYDTPPDEQQTEGSRKQTKAAQRADLLHNNRSAANSLAQTIGAASSSTQEAQVESNASPPPLHERRSRQKAPQASQLRLARRRPEFFGQAHERRDLLQLPCSPRSDLAHAALNSAAAQPLVAHELVKEQACFSQAACFRFFAFIRRYGGELGGRKSGGQGAGGGRRGRAASHGCGLRREAQAPAMPQRGTLRKFWSSCSVGGGSWGL